MTESQSGFMRRVLKSLSVSSLLHAKSALGKVHCEVYASKQMPSQLLGLAALKAHHAVYASKQMPSQLLWLVALIVEELIFGSEVIEPDLNSDLEISAST